MFWALHSKSLKWINLNYKLVVWQSRRGNWLIIGLQPQLHFLIKLSFLLTRQQTFALWQSFFVTYVSAKIEWGIKVPCEIVLKIQVKDSVLLLLYLEGVETNELKCKVWQRGSSSRRVRPCRRRQRRRRRRQKFDVTSFDAFRSFFGEWKMSTVDSRAQWLSCFRTGRWVWRKDLFA